MIAFLAGFLLGASAALSYALIRITRQKQRSITMHARRDRQEFVHRKYRDAEIVATVAPEVGGIDYRFLGQTGEEV